MKKILSLLLVAVMLFSLGACTQGSDGTYPKTGKYMNKENVYPRLSLEEDGEFKMALAFSSKSFVEGTFEVEDKILKLTEENGNVYCFKVKKETLVYDADISDKIETPRGAVEDGEKFIFVR